MSIQYCSYTAMFIKVIHNYSYFIFWVPTVYMINPLYLQEVSAVKYTLNAENIPDPNPNCVAPVAQSPLSARSQCC